MEDISGFPLRTSPATMLAQLRSGSISAAEGSQDPAAFETELPHNGVVPGDHSLVFNSSPQAGLKGAAYAVYSFSLTETDALTALWLGWETVVEPNQLRVALANWDSERWDWFSSDLSYRYLWDSLAPYTSESNQLLLVILIQEGSGEDLRQIQFLHSAPPFAQLLIDPEQVQAGQSFSLDASASSDDIGITLLHWDLDADGSFNEAGVERSFNGLLQASAEFAVAGLYDVGVRVRDKHGSIDIATRQIEVTAGTPPEAMLTATPSTVEQNSPVSLDASASTDSDGIADYEWDLDGDGLFSESGAETDARGNTSASATFFAPGLVEVGVRVSDIYGASSIALAGVTVTEYIAPTAVLDFSPTEVQQDQEASIELDASASSDSDGLIVDFEWDLDADGSFGEAGAESDASGMPTAAIQGYFTGPGPHFAVRVIDDDGVANEAYGSLMVHSWKSTVLADFIYLESFSMALVGGRPAVVYARANTGSGRVIVYGRADSGNGTDADDWTWIDVAEVAGGTNLSLAEVAGRPAFVAGGFSHGGGKRALEYFRSADATGTAADSWSAAGSTRISLIDNSSGSYYGLSLAVVAGGPAVAMGHYTQEDSNHWFRDIYYFSSSSTDGAQASDWRSPVNVHPIDRYDELWIEWDERELSACDLTEIDGRPALVYLEQLVDSPGGPTRAYYQISSSVEGDESADWQPDGRVLISVEHSDDPVPSAQCSRPSLVEISGAPAVVYSVDKVGRPCYRRAGTADGALTEDWLEANGGIHIQFSVFAGGIECLADNGGRPEFGYLRYIVPGDYEVWQAKSSSADGALLEDWSELGSQCGPVATKADNTEGIGLECVVFEGRLVFTSISMNYDQLIYTGWW